MLLLEVVVHLSPVSNTEKQSALMAYSPYPWQQCQLKMKDAGQRPCGACNTHFFVAVRWAGGSYLDVDIAMSTLCERHVVEVSLVGTANFSPFVVV